jgi:predicted nucleic-acid-binding protein
MIAASLDTNVLARLIVRDDDQQTQAASELLKKHVKKLETLFVPVTVMLELEWVLRSRYKFNKKDVVAALSSLLMTFELVFESELELEQALASYEDGGADYADCLHIALASKAEALPFLTFDVNAAKETGARLVKLASSYPGSGVHEPGRHASATDPEL